MKDFQNTVILIGFLLFTLISILAVSAEDLNNTSFNNSSHSSSNKTNNTTEDLDGIVQPMSIFINLNLDTSNVYLGELLADNQLNSYYSVTNVSVSAFLWGGLYIRASGDFTNGTNISRNIPLSNFQYDGFDNPNLDHETFSTTATEVRSWGLLGIDDTIPVNYYLTVPYGTDPAVYNVTVIYSVV